MAKKVLTLIKLQVPGGAANPAPPVGPALGQHGVNIMEFCKAFNAQTQGENGTIIPVEITVYEDRSFTFITKTPPAAVLIKQAIGIDKGSGEPNREKVGTITKAQVRAIAEKKMPDLNAHDLDQASKIIEGTARSMGVDVADGKHGKRYLNNLEKVDRERTYPPAEAMAIIKSYEHAKFPETVEVHIRTGLNVRHAEEQLRGTISLPHGLGKEMTVAVFAKGDKAREATEAGADHVGDDDLAAKVEEGFTDFDVAIATPDMMPVVGKLGRVLGPAGQDAQPEGRHRDQRHHQGGVGVQGRQGRVPHRPPRDRAPLDRQGGLRGERAAGELPRADGRDQPRQAGRREGPLHLLDQPHHLDGPGREGRPGREGGSRRGGGRASLTPELHRAPDHRQP